MDADILRTCVQVEGETLIIECHHCQQPLCIPLEQMDRLGHLICNICTWLVFMPEELQP